MAMKRWLLGIACVALPGILPTVATAATPAAACGERCLTLQGSKDADFGLGFSVAYATTATTPDCVSVNRLAGVTTQRTRTVFLPPVRKGTTYRIALPLDAHVGGACGWKPAGVFLDVVSVASRREPPKPGRSLFTFGDAPTTLPRLDLQCRRTSYPRASGAEQAAYQCVPATTAPMPALGPSSHAIELNFTVRP
ncbi:MAG: hypothetical protein ACREUW_03560 [Burkholderiales bacterium]